MRRTLFTIIIIMTLSVCLLSGCISTSKSSKNTGSLDYESKMIRLQPTGKPYLQEFSQEYYEKRLVWEKKYSPDATIESLRKENQQIYDNYKEIHIPIGASRIGGPVVDLPKDIKYPKGFYFAAQLNCEELKKYDEQKLLPEKGFLYFFTRDPGDEGIVLYTPKKSSELKRIVNEHTDWYHFGHLIGNVHSDVESIKSRYISQNGRLEWDFFAGTDITKVYGIYTNCQANEEEVVSKLEELSNKNMVLLLQIGSDFGDVGTQTVYINAEDLKKLDFSKCIFEYSQS